MTTLVVVAPFLRITLSGNEAKCLERGISKMADTTNAINNFRDTPEYKSQIEHLAKLITEDQTGKGKFVVLGVEAGGGKSRETDRIIAEYFNNTDPNRWMGHVHSLK